MRIFSQLPGSQVTACAEKDLRKAAPFRRLFPGTNFYDDHRRLIDDPSIDALVIATPSRSHHALAKEALLAGKHVLVEKPMTVGPAEARDICRTARLMRKVVMVGHTFLFNAGVQALKHHIRSGLLGNLHYLHAERTNLGPIRDDVNALLDLAPHDVSIFLDLLGKMPRAVSAHGGSYVKTGREDVVFLNLFFPGNVLANIHVSWLDPRKVRRLTVIGSRKMAVFDDVDVSETIKIYDKGVIKEKRYSNFGEFQMILRDGDILIPKVALSEPLKNQCQYFIDVLRGRKPLLSGPEVGLRVVEVMDAAQRSLRAGGKTVALRS